MSLTISYYFYEWSSGLQSFRTHFRCRFGMCFNYVNKLVTLLSSFLIFLIWSQSTFRDRMRFHSIQTKYVQSYFYLLIKKKRVSTDLHYSNDSNTFADSLDHILHIFENWTSSPNYILSKNLVIRLITGSRTHDTKVSGFFNFGLIIFQKQTFRL